MKKSIILLTLILVITGLCSCQKSLHEYSAESNLITIRPLTSDITVNTKAPIQETTFPSDRNIILAAYYNAPGDGTPANYFSNITFTNNGSVWTSDRVWPSDGTLDMLAYSTDGLSVTPDYDDKVSDGVSLIVSDTEEAQCDILWSAVSAQTNAGNVNMTFKHATAALCFTAKCATPYDASTNKGISIQSIEVKNAYRDGTVKLNNDQTCAWSNLTNQRNLLLPGLSSSYGVPASPLSGFGIGNIGLVVIPQTATTITVTYTVHNGKDAGDNNVNESGKTFNYECEGHWENGYKYTYAFNFSYSQTNVNISTCVSSWTDKENIDINVQK